MKLRKTAKTRVGHRPIDLAQRRAAAGGRPVRVEEDTETHDLLLYLDNSPKPVRYDSDGKPYGPPPLPANARELAGESEDVQDESFKLD